MLAYVVMIIAFVFLLYSYSYIRILKSYYIHFNSGVRHSWRCRGCVVMVIIILIIAAGDAGDAQGTAAGDSRDA